MRLVAGFAGDASGVLLGVDLREVFRLGRAGRMAADAEDSGVEFGRGDRRIVGVLGQRSVAGFAVDVRVLAVLLRVQNVRVAGFARIVAREVDGTGGHLRDRVPAVVPIFPKALRDNKVPDYEKYDEKEYEQKTEPEKMSCIFEKLHGAKFLPVTTGA